MSSSRILLGKKGERNGSGSEDSGSDAEEHVLEDLEEGEGYGEDGYALKEIRREEEHATTVSGAEQNDSDSDNGNDSQKEAETGDGDGDRMLLAPDRRQSQRYTTDEEKAVKRKLDRNLVLFVAFLYMLSFLDRGNLGNAKLTTLLPDLSLPPQNFHLLLTAFYTPYILFQPLSHLYTFLPAHIHLTCIVLSWGIISSLQSLCTVSDPLLFLRFLLGISEAAFAGIPIYLSTFFKREELAFRMGIFIAAAPLASSFAGALAAAILALGNKFPIASWRVLFLLEGFPAILISAVVWHRIPDTPSTARWLNSRDRQIAKLRLPPRPLLHKKGFEWKAALAPLKDPKAYILASLFFAVNVSFSSVPIFLPTILAAMGFSPLEAQGLTAPPYLVAVASILITAHFSDRYHTRSIPLMFHSSIACFGFLLLSTVETTGLGEWGRYAAVFPITSGLFSCVAGIITWQVNNEGTKEGKGTGFAALQMVGQCGSLVGAGMFPDKGGPYWAGQMAVCAGGMVWVGLGSWGLRWWLGRQNRKREGEERYIL